MRTDDLIVSLVADVRPVQTLRPPLVRFVLWLMAASIAAAIVVLLVGARPDFVAALTSQAFSTELALAVATMAAAGCSVLVSSVPGARGARACRVAACAMFVVWGLAVVNRLMAGGSPLAALWTEPMHAACPLRIAVAAFVPWVIVRRMVRQAAPLEPGWSAGLAALAASAAGAAAAQCMCPIDSASHAFTWHVVPVAVCAAAGALAGAANARHGRGLLRG